MVACTPEADWLLDVSGGSRRIQLSPPSVVCQTPPPTAQQSERVSQSTVAKATDELLMLGGFTEVHAPPGLVVQTTDKNRCRLVTNL
jgi:hypothetical protein